MQPAAGMNPAATFGVVELRRYALHPGGRDALIRLFESAFIESQERCGVVPIGHYRDLDDPDSFVWFRGFADMETRRGALEGWLRALDSSSLPEILRSQTRGSELLRLEPAPRSLFR